MPVLVNYHFSQRFTVSAKEAFDWCTDFSPQDHWLMGVENATREITQITENTVILTDTFQTPEGIVVKQKLVQLYPDDLTWTCTHLSGPNRHSQFLYTITPQEKTASTLTFNANYLECAEQADAKLVAENLCKADAAAWMLLAKFMETELKK
ncbi:MAG: hypothetical protein NWF01_02415 [Candidatus Bathyarchaeota archaeon]|nr:hypothetical protein [Candidatus Bathyarchaeota archaeon]